MNSTEFNLASNSKMQSSLLTSHLPGSHRMTTFNRTGIELGLLRLLVPVNAEEDSRWGIQYALNRHLEGTALEVVLLNVGAPVKQWQVLRFRTQQEIAQFQSESAQAFIEDASTLLESENIPYRGIFKQGEVVFSILDVAEELECDEIVLPTHPTGLQNIFSRGIISALRRNQRDIPIVFVDQNGEIS